MCKRRKLGNSGWHVGGSRLQPDQRRVDGAAIYPWNEFFKDEFGVTVKNLWLPDVFGYSAAMPQILKKCGINVMVTQKISWNQFNKFPHHSFIWRGIDGSEIVAHFPPENNYNSELKPSTLRHAESNFSEKDFLMNSSHYLVLAMAVAGRPRRSSKQDCVNRI